MASGSSSTIRVRRACIPSAPIARQRQPQRDEETAPVGTTPFAAGGRSITRQQPFAHIAETETGARLGHGSGRVDVILAPQPEPPLFMACRKADADPPLDRKSTRLNSSH